MKKRIINAPSREVLDMIKRKMPSDSRARLQNRTVDAIGLIMVSIPDLYFYADLANKSSNVVISEVFGSCPQHVTTLAVFGETSAVQLAIQAIEDIDSVTQGF